MQLSAMFYKENKDRNIREKLISVIYIYSKQSSSFSLMNNHKLLIKINSLSSTILLKENSNNSLLPPIFLIVFSIYCFIKNFLPLFPLKQTF